MHAEHRATRPPFVVMICILFLFAAKVRNIQMLTFIGLPGVGSQI